MIILNQKHFILIPIIYLSKKMRSHMSLLILIILFLKKMTLNYSINGPVIIILSRNTPKNVYMNSIQVQEKESICLI